MNQPVGSQDLAAGELERATVHVGYDSSRLFDQQDAGGGVPGIEIEFPKSFHPAGGNAAQIESRGAGAAHSMRAQRDLVVVVDVRALVALVAGEAGGDQALNQLLRLRDANSFSVQRRAGAALGGEELVACGIEDHAGNALTFVRESERNAEDREAVRKVRGSVERVHVPLVF